MALVVTLDDDISIGDTNHLYTGTAAFDSSYPTGGEAFDVSGNSSFSFVLFTPKSGYTFEWDKANQKVIARYADYDAVADGPLIQVPDTTDLSALTAVPFIAIGS